MTKNDRMEELADQLSSEYGYHRCYEGYFSCFNRGEYYEAHDILEHLWLKGAGENHRFYKGLIQFAGAFVHLKKQYQRPDHPKDGRRLRPASRLFLLAESNLSPYGEQHLGLNVRAVVGECRGYCAWLEEQQFSVNPWRPEHLPKLGLAPLRTSKQDVIPSAEA